jgi:hypothetical protein
MAKLGRTRLQTPRPLEASQLFHFSRVPSFDPMYKDSFDVKRLAGNQHFHTFPLVPKAGSEVVTSKNQFPSKSFLFFFVFGNKKNFLLLCDAYVQQSNATKVINVALLKRSRALPSLEVSSSPHPQFLPRIVFPQYLPSQSPRVSSLLVLFFLSLFFPLALFPVATRDTAEAQVELIPLCAKEP